jgi:hypothetical protein
MIDPCLTHIPILAKCVSKFGGNVLEFGTGMGSSPLLCTLVDGELCSFESNQSWHSMMKSGIHGQKLWTKLNHNLHFIPNQNWDLVYDIVDWNKKWSIAFVDHAPGGRRIVDIVRLKDLVDIILYHDSEEPSYGWKSLDGHFKSVYEFDVYSVRTTVVSNKYELKEILT